MDQVINVVYISFIKTIKTFNYSLKTLKMKTLSNIQEWLSTNPTENDVEKVMKIINKMNVSKTRRAVYEMERKLNRLVSVEKSLKTLNVAVPSEFGTQIKELKRNIETERKSLPVVKKRVKKVVEK